MPELYGSQHLFWYQFFATGLNALSVIVLTYFLVERARSGSSGIYHCLAAFERCLPAYAHPSLARHALLSVMRPDRSVFAAAIVPLPPPPAPPVNLSRSGSRRLLDVNAAPAVVSAPLTRGGRLVGTLTATVSLVVSRPD